MASASVTNSCVGVFGFRHAAIARGRAVGDIGYLGSESQGGGEADCSPTHSDRDTQPGEKTRVLQYNTIQYKLGD
jgi:hypothetical protein